MNNNQEYTKLLEKMLYLIVQKGNKSLAKTHTLQETKRLLRKAKGRMS